MGTNYYLLRNGGRGDEPLHIGKMSYGWCFALHIYPDAGINTLDDWMKLLEADGAVIKNDNGDMITAYKLKICITQRRGDHATKWDSKTFLENRAIPGPFNLARSKIDGRHCVGHGDGTWDFMIGEFS